MRIMLCSKTWCTHNGVDTKMNVTKCWCGSLDMEAGKCKSYECTRMHLVKIGEVEPDADYGGCRWCGNEYCKYKKGGK